MQLQTQTCNLLEGSDFFPSIKSRTLVNIYFMKVKVIIAVKYTA